MLFQSLMRKIMGAHKMSASLRWRNGPLPFLMLPVTARSSWHQGHVPQSHTNANPCRWDKGIPASQQGLYFSTGLLQSRALFALEINAIPQKLQEKVKYQQQKCLLCTSLSPLCFYQVTRRNKENLASQGWREKNQRSAELASRKEQNFE